MTKEEIIEKIADQTANVGIEAETIEEIEQRKQKLVSTIREALDMEISTKEIVDLGLQPGFKDVGDAFETGDAFIDELTITGRIMSEIVDTVIAPKILEEGGEIVKIKVVLGTVLGDQHDIGKKLVRATWKANGFEVIDLGIQVTAEKFVKEANNKKASLIGVSALLTTTREYMKKIVEERNKKLPEVPIIIGGAPITREFADEIGAEGYAPDCFAAVAEAKRLTAKE